MHYCKHHILKVAPKCVTSMIQMTTFYSMDLSYIFQVDSFSFIKAKIYTETVFHYSFNVIFVVLCQVKNERLKALKSVTFTFKRDNKNQVLS